VNVWVTRAEPEAQRTARALIDAGQAPLIEPLLQIEILARAEAPLAAALANARALAFTSITAVRVFARLQPGAGRGLPVFAVGAATAEAARAEGFAQATSADGDVADLAALIAARRPVGPLLHPRALEPAGDLVGDLASRGVEALDVAIYDTVPRAPSPAFLARLDGAAAGLEAVMIHSGKAAGALAPLLSARPTLARRLVLCAISETAARPLADFIFARRAIASEPNEPAMLEALTR
jgi:uroporphyrinogen-III synthase